MIALAKERPNVNQSSCGNPKPLSSRSWRAVLAHKGLAKGFNLSLFCKCVCRLHSAQCSSRDTMALKPPSVSAARTQTWHIGFPGTAFCFLLHSFLTLLSWQRSQIHWNTFILFVCATAHGDQSPALIGQELCGQKSDWLREIRATASRKNRYVYSQTVMEEVFRFIV